MVRFSCASRRCTSMCCSAPAGKIPPARSRRIGERAFSAQFVHRRPAHHSAHRHLSAHRRNQQRVAVFQPLEIGADAVQQQIIGVHFFDELLAAIMFQIAQRTALGDPSGRKQRIQRG